MSSPIKPTQKDFLGDDYVSRFQESAPAWQTNPLGEFVCRRTYCRVKSNGEYESWRDIVKRVVNGCYALQEDHVEGHNLGWSDAKGMKSAREMFLKMYDMKFLPPGRGLWAMGTDITKKKNIFAALNNCGFTSTADIKTKFSEPFRFLMDMSMLGVGVGFDLKGAPNGTTAPTFINNLLSAESIGYAIEKYMYDLSGTVEEFSDDESALAYTDAVRARMDVEQAEFDTYLFKYIEYLNSQLNLMNKKIAETPESNSFVIDALKKDASLYEWELENMRRLDFRACTIHKIEDTREGWVESTGLIIDSYLRSDNFRNILFYYGDIRPAGQLLKTFGGLSSGPEPLLDLHIMIRKILQKESETHTAYVTETIITDIMNLIGKCVVAGNVRRSSEIVLGAPESSEFMNLKNYTINPDRAAWGWCSNNSIYADVEMNYKSIVELIKNNGEPGLFWLDNVQKYSRMNGIIDNKDHRAIGTNPCITADTLILTKDGLKEVADLVGVQFIAIVDGKEYSSTSAGFWSNGIKPVYNVEFENGSVLTATEDHEIYTTVGKIPVCRLEKHHQILCDGGETTTLKNYGDEMSGAITIAGSQEVFDCTIDDVHCFIANGIKISNCSEQTLEDKELCCLVEVFINRHSSKHEFLRTLKFAYLYAKTVTLGDSHWVATNRVMMRNRRIGCSLTGIAQFLANNSLNVLKEWLDDGYDEIQRWDQIYSEWFAIPRSIKTTSIKPSGCLHEDTKVRVLDVSTGATNSVALIDLAAQHGVINAGAGAEADSAAMQYPSESGFFPLKSDLYILNKDNLSEKVTKLFYNGQAELLELQFEHGTVKCTPDHKFLVNNEGGTTEWRAAKDLRAGDDILSYS